MFVLYALQSRVSHQVAYINTNQEIIGEHLRRRIAPAGLGVEAPAESNTFAAVHDLEDREVLRDNDCARRLSGFLLVDEVLLAVD